MKARNWFASANEAHFWYKMGLLQRMSSFWYKNTWQPYKIVLTTVFFILFLGVKKVLDAGIFILIGYKIGRTTVFVHTIFRC